MLLTTFAPGLSVLFLTLAPTWVHAGDAIAVGATDEDESGATAATATEPDSRTDDSSASDALLATDPVTGVVDGVLTVRVDDGPDRTAGTDVSGTELGDTILVLRGTAHGYRFELGVDLDETNGSTLDRVFVERALDERHRARFGIVRTPFLFSAFADEDRFVFPYRSRLGEAFQNAEGGVELLADYGRADLRFALTNGSDGVDVARAGTLRVGLHLFGDEVPLGERPHTGADGGRLFLAYTDDGSMDRADAFAAEFHAQHGRYRLAVEFADAGPGLDDQRGWSATLAGSFDRGETEVALRAESLRRPVRRSAIGAAVSQSVYRDLLRFQVAAEMVEATGSTGDGLLLSAGAVLTF